MDGGCAGLEFELERGLLEFEVGLPLLFLLSSGLSLFIVQQSLL